MSASVSSPPLINLLAATINAYDDTDPAWRQFISDHKTYLLSQSQLQMITPSFFQSVVYDLNRFLIGINYNTHCTWIVRLINAIPSDVVFVAITALQIPQMRVIQDLYTRYRSIQ